MKKVIFWVGVFLWFTSDQQVWSQTRTKLNVVYPAVTGVMTALWVAAESKAFQKHGLDVSLLYIPSAPQVVRVMLAGESQITVTGGAPVVSANLSGADFVFVGGIVNVPAFYVMAAPEIKSLEDLKGTTVGVTRFGSSSDFAMRYVLQKYGLRPEKDVTLLQLGGMIELATALSKRLVAAATLSSPADLRARKSGAQELVNMATTGVSFPQSAIVTTRSYVQTHQDDVLSFLRGYAEGMQRMIADKPMAKKVIEKYTRESEPEIIESTYRYGVDYIAPIPYPAREGIAEILRQSSHSKAKTANPDEFIDMSLVKKLDEGGFFRRAGQR
ncbi:MAG TPA: ABC transporter substrate-binding protein [Candidatus Binatia bacterium]|nr:ABC transporter substrate-binding protein [Candidatus Binatia bacterium]